MRADKSIEKAFGGVCATIAAGIRNASHWFCCCCCCSVLIYGIIIRIRSPILKWLAFTIFKFFECTWRTSSMSRMSVAVAATAVAFVDNQFQLKFITLFKFGFSALCPPPITLSHVHFGFIFQDQKFLCA